MIATRDSLGIGLYTPEEAAFYARVSKRLMNRWLFGDGQGDPVVIPQLGSQQSHSDRTLTFLDMVQALAIRDIRLTFKIPLQKIRKAVDFARDKYGIEYPFAMSHTTYIVSNKEHKGHGELTICLDNDEEEKKKFIQISGRNSGNLLIRPIIEPYLEELQYDAAGIAQAYRPMRGGDDTILLNPHRRFGEPVLENSGHTAQTLWEAAIDEGSFEAAAKAYGVSEDAVRLAHRYFDHLTGIAV